MIIPPSFRFNGDKDKSQLLKAQATQFYNFVVNEADRFKLPFIFRTKTLNDGSSISVVVRKSSIFNNYSGNIIINSISKTQVELEDGIFPCIMDITSTTSIYPYPPANPPYRPLKGVKVYKSISSASYLVNKYFGGDLNPKDLFTSGGTNFNSYRTIVSPNTLDVLSFTVDNDGIGCTVYVNGRFCNLVAPPITPATPGIFYPYPKRCKLVKVSDFNGDPKEHKYALLMHYVRGSQDPGIETVFARFFLDFHPTLADQLIPTFISQTDATTMVVASLPGPTDNFMRLSPFSTVGRDMLLAVITDGLPNQSITYIYKLSFNIDYSSVVSTIITSFVSNITSASTGQTFTSTESYEKHLVAFPEEDGGFSLPLTLTTAGISVILKVIKIETTGLFSEIISNLDAIGSVTTLPFTAIYFSVERNIFIYGHNTNFSKTVFVKTATSVGVVTILSDTVGVLLDSTKINLANTADLLLFSLSRQGDFSTTLIAGNSYIIDLKTKNFINLGIVDILNVELTPGVFKDKRFPFSLINLKKINI